MDKDTAVRITDGPYEGFLARVLDVREEQGIIHVGVNLFGMETEVVLRRNEVEEPTEKTASTESGHGPRVALKQSTRRGGRRAGVLGDQSQLGYGTFGGTSANGSVATDIDLVETRWRGGHAQPQ